MSTQLHPSPPMGSCNAMTEPTPIMHGGPIGCCSSAPVPAFELQAGLPVGLPTIRGEDEEALWESDWVSDWESDWESGAERDQQIVKQTIEDKLEPRLARLRPRNTETPKTDDDHPEHGIKRLKSNDPVILKKNEDDDAEPKIMRLKCIKTLTGDDRDFDDDDIDIDDEETAEADDSEDSGSEEEDHVPGAGCHFCKYSRIKRKVRCSRCPIRFCELCLQNRNGERIEIEIQEGVKWVCPKCRGGCGPGCKNCCTCPRCRRSQGLPPAGQLNVRIARHAGFDNVHDYLIHLQTGECPLKIAKRKEGRGWTNCGGAINSGCFTGITPAKLKLAEIWTPPHCATNWADQQTGLSWTIPKVVSDNIKSAGGNVIKQRDGEQGGANKLARDTKKPANKLEAWKLKNEQFKRALKEKSKSLDPDLNQAFGSEAQKPMRIKLSLDQILNRLLHPEQDRAGQDRGPLFGSIQHIRRNRKHRNLRRILEPSMFRMRSIQQEMATKINKVTPGFPPTVRTDNVHPDESSKAPIMPAKESTSQLSGLDVRHGQQQDRPLFGASIPLKKPITSLQALRKMGVFSAKRNNIADLVGQEASQKQRPAIAPGPQFDPSTKHRFQVAATSSPTGSLSLSRGQGFPQKQVPAIAPRPLFHQNLTRGLHLGASSSAAVPKCSWSGQTTLQKQGSGNAPLSEQSLKQYVPVVASASPVVPPSVSSESGSQAIRMRHSERRKKMVLRSCSKSHNSPTLAMSSCEELAPEGIEWKGQLVRSRLTDPQSEFMPLGETRSVRRFELPRHGGVHGGVQSGFESFSQRENSIGFGPFRGDESGLAALRT